MYLVKSVLADGDGPDLAWLSTRRAAQHLGITTRTLYRFIDRGEIPAYRFGRVIRLKQREVDAFIETHRIQPRTLDDRDPGEGPPSDN